MSVKSLQPPDAAMLLAKACVLPANRACHTRHGHAGDEFILVERGTGTHLTGLGAERFQAGDLFFFARGQFHRHVTDGTPCRVWVIRYHEQALTETSDADRFLENALQFLKRRAFLGQHRIVLGRPTQLAVRRLFADAVREDRERREGYRHVLRALAAQAVIAMFRDPALAFEHAARRETAGLAKVLEALDADPTRPVTVAAMARLASMSRSHFHAAFKRFAGVTLLTHVQGLRVGLACRLLVDTDDAIADICFQSGFSGLSRFYAAFRRYQGLTPLAYRRQQRTPHAE